MYKLILFVELLRNFAFYCAVWLCIYSLIRRQTLERTAVYLRNWFMLLNSVSVLSSQVIRGRWLQVGEMLLCPQHTFKRTEMPEVCDEVFMLFILREERITVDGASHLSISMRILSGQSCWFFFFFYNTSEQLDWFCFCIYFFLGCV